MATMNVCLFLLSEFFKYSLIPFFLSFHFTEKKNTVRAREIPLTEDDIRERSRQQRQREKRRSEQLKQISNRQTERNLADRKRQGENKSNNNDYRGNDNNNGSNHLVVVIDNVLLEDPSRDSTAGNDNVGIRGGGGGGEREKNALNGTPSGQEDHEGEEEVLNSYGEGKRKRSFNG